MHAAQIDSLLPLDPRVQRAGFWGATVYLHLLLLNRAHQCLGLIPSAYCAPAYLARHIGLDRAAFLSGSPAELVKAGLIAARNEALVAFEPDGVRLVDRRHWESESAERVRRHRAGIRRDKMAQRQPGAIGEQPRDVMSHGAGARQDAPGTPWAENPLSRGAAVPIVAPEARQVALARSESPALVAHPHGVVDALTVDATCNVQPGNVQVTSDPPLSPSPFSPPQTPPLYPHPQTPPDDVATGRLNVTDLGLDGGDLELPFPPEWLSQGGAPSSAVDEPTAGKGKKKRGELPGEAYTLAEQLRTWIVRNVPNTKMAQADGTTQQALLERWADPIDKLHRIDGAPWSEISATIDWVGRDQFWGGVVLSGDNLRRHWVKLQAQRARRGDGPNPTPTKGRHEPVIGAHADGDQEL